MFLTRKDVSDAMRLTILEQAMEKSPERALKLKNYILKEMSYEQALNMVMNPFAEKFIPAAELENVFYEFCKTIEDARITLLENNKGKRRSLVSTLREQYVLLEETPPPIPGKRSLFNRLGTGAVDVAKGVGKFGGKTVHGTAKAAGHIPVEVAAGLAKGIVGQKHAGKIDSFMDAHGSKLKAGTGYGAGAIAAGTAAYGAHKLNQMRKARQARKAAAKAAKAGPAPSAESLDENSATFDQSLKTNRRPNAEVNCMDESIEGVEETKGKYARRRDSQQARSSGTMPPHQEPSSRESTITPQSSQKATMKDRVSHMAGQAKDAVTGAAKAVGNKWSNMGTAGKFATGLGGAAALTAAGYGAHKWAKRRAEKKRAANQTTSQTPVRQQAALTAAATMEAASELALAEGRFEDHIHALREAHKWVERAYTY